MKIVITAGGTGGHIYPAMAIINKLKERNKDIDVLYIGTTDRMESKIVPEKGIPYVGIEMHGFNRNHPLKSFKSIICTIKAVKKCKEVLRKFNPDVVLGVGGYVTFPVLYAAHRLGIKTMIHEQNSIPGLSNTLVANFVDKIFISLPGSEQYFEKNTILTGNPRREEIIEVKKANKEEIGFTKNKKLVIIVMGSLGSATVNNTMKDILLGFTDKKYEVLYITGEAYFDDFKKLKVSDNVKICAKREDLISIMKSADLIVSRAGAIIISDITGIGLPSILVPSPYVTNNHQYKNAKALEDRGACVLLEEKNLTKDNLLNEIDGLLKDKEKRALIKKECLRIAKKDSTTRICEEVESVVK